MIATVGRPMTMTRARAIANSVAGAVDLHKFSALCACPRCADHRGKARSAKRDAFHEGQQAAAKVTRYGYHLVNVQTEAGPGVISRTGTAYARDEHGTIRRVGSAVVQDKRLVVVAHGQAHGKAAKKAAKRARMAERARRVA